MLTDLEKAFARELLSLISPRNLFALVGTVTNNLVEPCAVEEATECILQHSPTADSLLSRKKVSREVLFQYLHNKKVDVDSTLEKKALVSKIIELWNVGSTSVQRPPLAACNTVVPHVDELAMKFSEWFYQLLNSSVKGEHQAGLGSEHFWPNCNLALRMESASGCLEHFVKENSGEAVQLLCATCIQHRLFFNPNLTCDGVRGQVDSHGLVTVMTCGTLHVDSTCVGVFEQCFGLIRDPSACNNWKIKTVDLQMKATSVSSIPTVKSKLLVDKLCLKNL